MPTKPHAPGDGAAPRIPLQARAGLPHRRRTCEATFQRRPSETSACSWRIRGGFGVADGEYGPKPRRSRASPAKAAGMQKVGVVLLAFSDSSPGHRERHDGDARDSRVFRVTRSFSVPEIASALTLRCGGPRKTSVTSRFSCLSVTCAAPARLPIHRGLPGEHHRGGPYGHSQPQSASDRIDRYARICRGIVVRVRAHRYLGGQCGPTTQQPRSITISPRRRQHCLTKRLGALQMTTRTKTPAGRERWPLQKVPALPGPLDTLRHACSLPGTES